MPGQVFKTLANDARPCKVRRPCPLAKPCTGRRTVSARTGSTQDWDFDWPLRFMVGSMESEFICVRIYYLNEFPGFQRHR